MQTVDCQEVQKTKPVVSLRVQVPNNHILTQNLYYDYYYPDPKYLIIWYMDPLGLALSPSQAVLTIDYHIAESFPSPGMFGEHQDLQSLN